MGLMKDKFIELCEREGLKPQYEKRLKQINYKIKKCNSDYEVFGEHHQLYVFIDEPKAMKVILEFSGFVSTLIENNKG